MAKILETNQSFAMGHFVETLHLIDDKLESNVNVANNAQETANAALSTSQNAVDRLAGDQDFFIGYFNITTKTTAFTPDVTVESNQGITWDTPNKKFNFAYLGWYLFEISSWGDLANSRTDWYQEFTVRVKQNGTLLNDNPITIPPSMTKSIRTTKTVLVKVSMGDVITIDYFNVANGVIQVGAYADIKVKKVV